MYNLLWSDPLQADQRYPQQTFGVHQSPRARHSSIMKSFGRDVTERFCVRENLGLVIRSHQFRSTGEGYELMHDGWLLRVFSARNYLGKHSNAGGIIQIGRAEGEPGTLLVRPQIVEQLRRNNEEPAKSWPPPRPYCPDLHLMHLVSAPSRRQVECGPAFLRSKRRQPEPVHCIRCKEHDLRCYFHCHGCGTYDICLVCAESLATPTKDEISDDSDSSDDGNDDSGSPCPCPCAAAVSSPHGEGVMSVIDDGAQGPYPALLQNADALRCASSNLQMKTQCDDENPEAIILL